MFHSSPSLLNFSSIWLVDPAVFMSFSSAMRALRGGMDRMRDDDTSGFVNDKFRTVARRAHGFSPSRRLFSFRSCPSGGKWSL